MNTKRIVRPLVMTTTRAVWLLTILPLSVLASPIMWVNAGGQLATVDITTGAVTLAGSTALAGCGKRPQIGKNESVSC